MVRLLNDEKSALCLGSIRLLTLVSTLVSIPENKENFVNVLNSIDILKNTTRDVMDAHFPKYEPDPRD